MASPDEIAVRRTRVSELDARGFTQSQIARSLGVSETTVYRDLVWLREQRSDGKSADLDELKGRQIAILEAVQQEALAAFRQSKKGNRRLVHRQRRKGAADSPDSEMSVLEEDSAGDRRLLDAVTRSSQQIGKLAGIDLPPK